MQYISYHTIAQNTTHMHIQYACAHQVHSRNLGFYSGKLVALLFSQCYLPIRSEVASLLLEEDFKSCVRTMDVTLAFWLQI